MRVIIKEAGIEYKVEDAPKIKTPLDASEQCGELKDSNTEGFVVLMLDARNCLISAEIVTMGLLDASLVHPREVFRSAIEKNACAVVLLHNHPSGDPSPSADDVKITKQLVEAGRIIDIKVLDHVIIGTTGYKSLREDGIVKF